jgi:hypothetical protein
LRAAHPIEMPRSAARGSDRVSLRQKRRPRSIFVATTFCRSCAFRRPAARAVS